MLFKKCVIAFEYFFRPIEITETREKHLNSFLKLLYKKYSIHCISNDFVCKYFFFQYKYWKDLNLSKFNGKMELSYIVGKKAFDRWLNRNVEFDFELELYPKQLLADLKQDNDKGDNRYEEVEKKRFYGTIRGFNHCIEKTTLYNRLSKNCFDCRFKVECIEVQRVNFTNIYKQRKNG